MFANNHKTTRPNDDPAMSKIKKDQTRAGGISTRSASMPVITSSTSTGNEEVNEGVTEWVTEGVTEGATEAD